MYPTTTQYYIVVGTDYAACEAFRASQTQEPPHDWHFPTVMAKRGEEIIGYLGSYEDDGDLVVGPLALRGDVSATGRAILALRLLQAMQCVAERAGVTEYWFAVDKDRVAYQQQLTRLGLMPVEGWTDLQVLWYRVPVDVNLYSVLAKM